MNKEVIKLGFNLVTMIGVDEIVGNTIKHVNPQNMNMAKKVCVGFASMAISGCILNAVNKYVDDTIDEVFDWAESIFVRKEDTDETVNPEEEEK